MGVISVKKIWEIVKPYLKKLTYTHLKQMLVEFSRWVKETFFSDDE
jgi:hypothetical protein